jgi:hypothetical protein
MLIRAVNQCERTVKAEPPNVITLVAATSTVVLQDLELPSKGVGGINNPPNTIPNINTDLGMEIAARYIFNDTGAVLYYAFGQTCDNVSNYHGKIANQSQLDVSNYGGQVCCYSVAGGKVAPTVLHRQDLFQHANQAGKPALQGY